MGYGRWKLRRGSARLRKREKSIEYGRVYVPGTVFSPQGTKSLRLFLSMKKLSYTKINGINEKSGLNLLG
jgi:hypothetical protein